MRRNFRTDSGGAEVVVANARIDLHNLYSVADITNDPTRQTLMIRFARDHRWRGPPDLPEEVALRCRGDLDIAYTDISVMSASPDNDFELFYFSDDCSWDELLDEKLAERQGFDGLHLHFGDGLALRVRCAEAEIVTSPAFQRSMA